MTVVGHPPRRVNRLFIKDHFHSELPSLSEIPCASTYDVTELSLGLIRS